MFPAPAHLCSPIRLDRSPPRGGRTGRAAIASSDARCARAGSSSSRRITLTSLVAALAVTAAPASAQPVTHPEPEPCRVTIAYAPDAVRATIEAWVAAEPRCDKQLEVRVVPTEGGLYLFARDDQGHVRQRVVPDAEAAAVLVVSWIADDDLARPSAVEVEPPLPPPVVELPPAAPAPATDVERPPLPLLGDGLGLSGGRSRGRADAPHAPRWLTLGALGGADGDLGGRVQLDVLRRGRWLLGGAAAWQQAGRGHGGDGHMTDTDQVGRVVGYVGSALHVGPIELRLQLGAGVELRSATDLMGTRRTASPVGEAALLGTLPLGASWGLVGGPVVDVAGGRGTPSAASVSVFLGLARRL
jgi:hypothetical protein